MLLHRTGFKCLRIYKEGILLQLLLQKALWRIKDMLKDPSVVEDLKSKKDPDRESGPSVEKARI